MWIWKPTSAKLILAFFAVLLLSSVVLAAIAPILAPTPAESQGWTAPPLPNRNEPLPGFQPLLEPLPLVVRDLPDAGSQEAVAAYEQASITDMDSLVTFISSAFDAVLVPTHLRSDWFDWLSSVVEDPAAADPVPPEILEALQEDPLNGDRLVNFAVALFYYGTIVVTDVPSFDTLAYETTKGHAVVLLGSVVEKFPENRAALLNYMYFSPLNYRANILLQDDQLNTHTMLQDWVVSHPGDYTALYLLVRTNLSFPSVIEGIDSDALHEHLNELATDEDHQVAALALALLGDSLLSKALLSQRSAPFEAERLAREALNYYDQALKISDDVSLFNARATALEVLGDIPSAVVSLERAIEIEPESIALRTRLAELYLEQHWHGVSVEEAAEQSRTMSRSALDLVAENGRIPLTDLQLLPYPGEFLDGPHNLTLDRSHKPYFIFGSFSGGRGGGFTVAFDLIPLHNGQPGLYGQHFLSRPFDVAIRASMILGDVDGVHADHSLVRSKLNEPAWFWTQLQYDYDKEGIALTSARLVAGWSNPSAEDLYYAWEHSAELLRFSGHPERALAICQAAVEHLESSLEEMDRLELWNCVGENAYLISDYDTAQNAFEINGNDLMAGFIEERRGESGQAVQRYREALKNPGDYFPEEHALNLRLADLLLDQGDSEAAIKHYDAALEYLSPYLSPMEMQHLFSNRGIARLQMHIDRDGKIDCNGTARSACSDALLDFDSALQFDPHNPVFLMNKAWASRLLGDSEMSAELMKKALESDVSLYPVHNDLGVLAAQNDDSDEARQYFLQAVAANPHYDLGWWNLGVLEMQRGPGGIIRGQAYLARAIKENPSLATSSLNFKTDESIYRVEITEQDQPGTGWAFSKASSLATTALGAMGVLLIIFHASKNVFRERIVEEITNRTESVRPWFEKNLKPWLAGLESWKYSAMVLLAVTIAVMVVVAVIPAWRGDPATAAASVTLALFAVALAVITHEFGHRLSARLMDARLEPVQWTPGLGLALVLLPFNLSSGPFPAQRVISRDDTNTLWVYLFGPLANLGVAVISYMLYLGQPLPVFRLIAITQLVVMSYALLPFEPLDGAPLSRAQPKLVGGLASFALLAGVLFSVGIL